MLRFLSSSLVTLLLAVPVAYASQTGPADSQALLRLASALSGLRTLRPVPVAVEQPASFRRHRLALHDRLYPAADRRYDELLYGALGLPSAASAVRAALAADGGALYDPLSRRASVPRGAESRRALLGALVHALQDQHFGLRRPSSLGADPEARLAAEAVRDGQALLATDLLRPRVPAAVAVPSPVQRFVEFRRAFPGTIGLRFAVTLRNLGGNAALFGALRRFPATTEQVFHIDKFFEREPAVRIALPREAAGLVLEHGGTFGELDVRGLLAAFGIPGRDGVGSGWGGGRSAIYRSADAEAVLVALDWDSEKDAAEWQAAVSTYVPRAFPAAQPVDCAAEACWAAEGNGAAFAIDGARTALVLGNDTESSTALARAVLVR
jgi:hypothetical protein